MGLRRSEMANTAETPLERRHASVRRSVSSRLGWEVNRPLRDNGEEGIRPPFFRISGSMDVGARPADGISGIIRAHTR